MTRSTPMAAVAFLLFTPVAWAQTDEPTVLVRVTMDAGYADTTQKLKLLEAVLEQARIREVAAVPGDTPNSIIVRELGFGPSNRPKSYKLVEDAVRRLNPQFSERAASGNVLIPDIGEWALSGYSKTKAANYVPKIQRWKVTQMESRGAEVVFQGAPTVTEAGREASQSIANEYAVPASVAEGWKEDPEFDGEILNFPMEALLAATDDIPEANLELLNAEEKVAIRGMLSTAARKSLVVIADTGWPTKEAYESSLRTFATILNTVRKEHLKLDAPVTFPSNTFTAADNPHCRQIERALREFESLDDGDHVQVVYVPLTREQSSSPLLRELLAFDYLLGLMKRAPSKVRPTSQDQATAAQQVETIIQQLPAIWTKDQPRVRTDKALLQAYLLVLNLYSASADVDTTFFFNTSWTTPAGEYFVAFPPALRGAMVAAAGNDGQDFVATKSEFARRTIGQRDTIAVLNMDGSGVPLSHSSLLAASDIKSALAVGLDGRVTPDGTVTGTSFSAPRAAWLFAAAECVRPQRFDLRQWGFDAMNLLAELRGANPSLAAIRIEPVSFLRRASQ